MYNCLKSIATIFITGCVFLLLFSVSCKSKIDKESHIVGWGDSMMAGAGGDASILEVIVETLDGVKSSKNYGVGGLSSSSVAVLQGGKPLSIVFENDTMHLEENTIKHYNVAPLNFQTKQYREGRIGEIQGVLHRKSDEKDNKVTLGYSFTPDLLKARVATNDTVVFVFNDAQEARIYPTLFWAGRNDKKKEKDRSLTVKNLQSMVKQLDTSVSKKYLVLSICNGIADSEYRGSKAYTEIIKLNARLEEIFEDHYVDIRTYMVEKAIYDLGLTPTSQDLEDIRKDCIPRQLLFDNVHFNTLGYKAAGNYIAQIIKEKGWYKKLK